LKEEGKISEAYSKATQSSKLTGDMIEESKELLDAMGIPYIQASSEGEAQAAFMSSEGDVYAVGSQDWDCMLFGADRMVRNLTSRKTRKTSSGKRKEVKQQRIELEKVLEELDLKDHESLESLMEDEKFEWGSDNSPEAVYDFFINPPVEKVDFSFESPDNDRISDILVDQHDFSEDRISSKLKDLEKALESRQSGLGSFT
jgi:flap endonuclease-1